MPLDFFNNASNSIIAGIDEAGRGPLAGPVVAACLVIDEKDCVKNVNDSKKLSKKLRFCIYQELISKCRYGIGVVDHLVIDKINILQATKLAMHKAFLDLEKKYQIFPEIILVDGNFVPFKKESNIKDIIPIIKGDQKEISIAGASIIAKETRDKIMQDYDKKFPEYGFAKHSGYPTKFHLEQIKKHGICEIHRKSFAPIKQMVNL